MEAADKMREAKPPVVTNGDCEKINANANHQYESFKLTRPIRNDAPLEANVFPNSTEGQLLRGLARSFLIKQEPRLGWARKAACDEKELLAHPCEVVASHQWGVMWLVLAISRSEAFKREVPKFDHARAYEMAAEHDLAELVTGDITPVEGISPEEKHRLESEAMDSILGNYPAEVAEQLHAIYNRYETRECLESKFVKDCDKLDFLITAFMLERQGFRGFEEFYPNSNKGFTTQIAQRLANVLIETRDKLAESNSL